MNYARGVCVGGGRGPLDLDCERVADVVTEVARIVRLHLKGVPVEE